MIAFLLYTAAICSAVIGVAAFSRANYPLMFVVFIVVLGCSAGIDRNEASNVCDLILKKGGKAEFVSGKCYIFTSSSVIGTKTNGRILYINTSGNDHVK